MKWFLMLCVACVGITAQAANVPVKNASLQKYEEQVIELPEDGNVWATIVCTSDDWRVNAKERNVVSWFASNPRLAGLASQTKFYHFTASNLIYKHKFASVVQGQFPCVIVQTYDGTKAYKISGNKMPAKANALADAIGAKLHEVAIRTATPTVNHTILVSNTYGRLRPRPAPCVQPQPAPAQPVPTTVNVAPPTVPDDSPAVPDDMEPKPRYGGVVLVGVLGFIGIMLYMLHKAVSSGG